MAFQGSYTFNSPVATGDTSKEIAVRDPLLKGVLNSGVRFLMDLAFGFSYPGGPLVGRAPAAAPAQNAVVYDVAERANGRVYRAADQVVAYAGGGFDTSAITKRNEYVEIPASVAADIYTAFSGNSQQFMVVAYFRLPTQANWNASGTLFPMLSFSGEDLNYTNAPDLVLFAQTATLQQLAARRQTAVGTSANLIIQPVTADYGGLAQLAYWRNAAGSGFRMRTVNGSLATTGAAGAANTADFSAMTGKVGTAGLFISGGAGQSAMTDAGQFNAVKSRLYRLFVENLARSGRDPATVLDADWTRVQARIAASAAANGGTSLIFV